MPTIRASEITYQFNHHSSLPARNIKFADAGYYSIQLPFGLNSTGVLLRAVERPSTKDLKFRGTTHVISEYHYHGDANLFPLRLLRRFDKDRLG
jgi:hypothetical protein